MPFLFLSFADHSKDAPNTCFLYYNKNDLSSAANPSCGIAKYFFLTGSLVATGLLIWNVIFLIRKRTRSILMIYISGGIHAFMFILAIASALIVRVGMSETLRLSGSDTLLVGSKLYSLVNVQKDLSFYADWLTVRWSLLIFLDLASLRLERKKAIVSDVDEEKVFLH